MYSNKMIKAMKLLRQYYQDQLDGKEPKEMVTCVLCLACGGDCSICPWMVETGKSCSHTSKHSLGMLRTGKPYWNCKMYIPKQTITKWRKRRIKELTKWIGES